jgi:hypothetical protein
MAEKFKTISSFSGTPGVLCPSVYIENATLHFGFREFLNIPAIYCEITFTVAFTSVTSQLIDLY